MRYDTYMRRPKEGCNPGVMICVDTVAETNLRQEQLSIYQDSLLAWHALTLELRDNKLHFGMMCTGTDSSSFWATASKLINDNKNPWLMSYQCGLIWHLLDLWDCIEFGEISIAGHDQRKPRGRFRRKGELIPGFIVIEDPPCILKFHHAATNRAATWVDTRNYGVEPPGNISPGEDTCKWIADWYIRAFALTQELKLGQWRATAGSQAFNGWRMSYLNTGIYCHVQPTAISLEASGYYGGRCEPFSLGSRLGKYTSVDYRSMYPAICRDIAMPVRLAGIESNEFAAFARVDANPRSCIAEITVETDEPLYPCHAHLPIDCQAAANGRAGVVAPAEHGTEIIYPVGRFRTTLAGPELEDALNHNCVKEIHSLAWYEMEKCLYDYAVAVYAERCKADNRRDKPLCEYIKRLLVTIVGKLGQMERYWEDCPGFQTDLYYGTWYGSDGRRGTCRYRSIAGHVQRDRTLGFHPVASPAIAAWITSEGRCRLLAAMRQAGFHEVVYVDTDGLIVTQLGLQRLRDADMIRDCELGYLREVITADGVQINGIKDYILGTKTVRAGVPKNAHQNTHNGVSHSNRRTIKEDIYSRVRPTSCRNSALPVRRELYRHAVVSESGTVRPWKIREDGVLI